MKKQNRSRKHKNNQTTNLGQNMDEKMLKLLDKSTYTQKVGGECLNDIHTRGTPKWRSYR